MTRFNGSGLVTIARPRPSYSFINSNINDGGSGTTMNVTTVIPPFTQLVIALCYMHTGTISGVTIGGVAATSLAAANTNTGVVYTDIFSLVPGVGVAGTSVTSTLTVSATFKFRGMALYALSGLSSTTVKNTATIVAAGVTAPRTQTIACSYGDLVFSQCDISGTTFTPTNTLGGFSPNNARNLSSGVATISSDWISPNGATSTYSVSTWGGTRDVAGSIVTFS